MATGVLAPTPNPPTPVSLAPKETGLQKVESIFTNIGKVIQNTENVIINVGVAEAPLLTKFLPPTIATAVNNALNVAASTFAALEAQEQQIGTGSTPYAAKAALIVALQGGAIAKILAAAGLEAGQADVQQVINVATGIGALNFATLDKAPVPAAPAA